MVTGIYKRSETHNKNISEGLKKCYSAHKRKPVNFMLGKHWSDNVKIKIGNSNRGKKRSEKFREECRKRNIGKKLSAEHKIKIGLSNKGRIVSEETKQKVREATIRQFANGMPNQTIIKRLETIKKNGGFHHTQEYKEKMRIFRSGKKHSEQSKIKISNIKKGHPVSIETREKLRICAKEQMKNPIRIEKLRNGYLNSIKNNPSFGMRGKTHTKEARLKLSIINIGKISSKKGKKFNEFYGEEKSKIIKNKIREARIKQIFPIKDTKIEVKMQNLLKELNLEFYTHQYMNEIQHGYQCDILIPEQEGITKKTIIECFGNYWHRPYPTGREIDLIRINELREAGWRVLVFWENEIKVMELNDLKLVIEK